MINIVTTLLETDYLGVSRISLPSLQSKPEVTLDAVTPTKSHFPGISVMCYYGGIECIYAFGFDLKTEATRRLDQKSPLGIFGEALSALLLLRTIR